MLSLTCKTAVNAVILLASNEDETVRMSLIDISEDINASSHTVGKILQTLVRHGIIKSTKGPTGGFYITKSQKNQEIISIVEAIDGKHIFDGCGLGLSQCTENHPCPIHNQYKGIRDTMETLFAENKIIDLCQSVNMGKAFLFG